MRTSTQLGAIRLAATVCFMLPLSDTFGQTESPVQTPPQPIRMSLIATDRFKRAVDDLRQEEIQLIEDDQPRQITFFARDDRPVHYTIALDTSGSFRFLLPYCLNVVRALIENNRPNDETMLISFVSSDQIEKVQDFTADKSKLLDSLKLIRVTGGQTAVIDAVHISVEATAAYKASVDVRRIVILISDGEDRRSFYTQDQMLKLLREKDVQIFIIGIVGQLSNEGLTRPSPREKADKLLNRLAEETGGQVFLPKGLPELAQAAQQINKHLGSQYIIGFERENKPGEKGFRKVKVSIVRAGAEKLVAITRPGYWAGPREPARKDKE